jgi:pimeloyl-ACP methyl ester carboxylesterase
MKLIDYLRRLFGRAEHSAPAPAMREHTLSCHGPHGSHDMAYVEWGAADNPDVLICVHGLTRNCRDFDFLAEAMLDRYRVICPDIAGRGRSEWLTHSGDYGFPLYVADMQALLAHLGAKTVDWVGTSMGGLIGMLIASQMPDTIKRLVLNDVGPVLTAQSLQRIGKYTGNAPVFDDVAAAEMYIRFVSAPFGKLTDAQWRHLTIYSIRQRPDGKYEMGYDPGIADAFRQTMIYVDVNLWPVYDAIKCPTLVLHGAESDLLTAETVRKMADRGPKAKTVDIPGVGHAPVLMDAAQIDIVRNFLLDH